MTKTPPGLPSPICMYHQSFNSPLHGIMGTPNSGGKDKGLAQSPAGARVVKSREEFVPEYDVRFNTSTSCGRNFSNLVPLRKRHDWWQIIFYFPNLYFQVSSLKSRRINYVYPSVRAVQLVHHRALGRSARPQPVGSYHSDVFLPTTTFMLFWMTDNRAGERGWRGGSYLLLASAA